MLLKTHLHHILSLILCLSISAMTRAADIRPYIQGDYRAIVIEGLVEPGDFDTFIKIVKENNGKVSGVHIFSSGGDFYEAMKIGRAMRALELSSQAPMKDAQGRPICGYGGFGPMPNDSKNCNCASAGFFIHIGAVHRGGNYLVVHRPYFGKGKFGNLSQADAKKAYDALQSSAKDYMEEMGVPKHVQEDVLGTPSDKGLLLDEKTVKTYFWLQLPYYHEWILNKCARLTDQERERYEAYGIRIRTPKNASEIDLTNAELEDYQLLNKKQREEDDCALQVSIQSKITAYEKYFARKAYDYNNYKFSKWTEAIKYLGKQYYEVQEEEKFEQDTLMGWVTLNRQGTANTPALNLYDSKRKPKIVTSVTVISSKDPSSEFMRLLVLSIENAWGKKSGGDGLTEWKWRSNTFTGILKKPSDGHHVTLSIDGIF